LVFGLVLFAALNINAQTIKPLNLCVGCNSNYTNYCTGLCGTEAKIKDCFCNYTEGAFESCHCYNIFEGLTPGEKAGIAIAVIIFVFAVLIGLVCLRRYRRRRHHYEPHDHHHHHHDHGYH